MTEIDIYRPAAAQLTIPAAGDTDSWIAVVQDIIKIANVIFDTPFVPDGLRGSAPAVAAAMLAGREMGLGIMTSLANIDVIKGRPTQKALLMRAMIQSKGHKWQDGDVSDVRAVVRGCRKGESEWAEVTFTAAQAKTAGIDLGKYPADKLYARATSRLARRKFADVIMGMPYSAEELEDGDDPDAIEQAPAAAIEPLKQAAAPRTAQRRQRTAEPTEKPDPTPPPQQATASPPSGSATAEPVLQPTEMIPVGTEHAGLPPLPGEDDPGPDEPGTVEPGQLTAMWATFTTDLGFTKDDKAEARKVCEKIIGRKLTGGTTGNLSRNEASTCIDTLKLVRTRDRLIALMNDGELPAESETGNA